MPQNKKQRVIFGIIMAYAMAYGMEIYNIAIKQGINLTVGGFSNLTNSIFLEALREAAFMGLLVILFSSLWGERLGAAFAARHCDPEKDNPYICRILRQAGTVIVMCPSMSLAASILYQVVLGGEPVTQLPAIWLGTTMKNLPMAFFWNMYVAAPFTYWIFGKLFAQKKERSRA